MNKVETAKQILHTRRDIINYIRGYDTGEIQSGDVFVSDKTGEELMNNYGKGPYEESSITLSQQETISEAMDNDTAIVVNLSQEFAFLMKSLSGLVNTVVLEFTPNGVSTIIKRINPRVYVRAILNKNDFATYVCRSTNLQDGRIILAIEMKIMLAVLKDYPNRKTLLRYNLTDPEKIQISSDQAISEVLVKTDVLPTELPEDLLDKDVWHTVLLPTKEEIIRILDLGPNNSKKASERKDRAKSIVQIDYDEATIKTESGGLSTYHKYKAGTDKLEALNIKEPCAYSIGKDSISIFKGLVVSKNATRLKFGELNWAQISVTLGKLSKIETYIEIQLEEARASVKEEKIEEAYGDDY
jgi:hypothetical protein